jgi:hypothetical protein
MTRKSVRGTARPNALAALVAALVALAVLVSAAPALGQAAPSPSAPPADLRMSATPFLGGAVRPGAWMAVRVRVENDGPAVRGELRVSGGQQGETRYGVEVELPTGARQEHLLYAQPAWFGSSLAVSLVSDGRSLLEQRLATRAVDAWTPTIVVVAERPEGIVADLRAGVTNPNLNPPVILTVGPGDLPPRVEAWSAIDRLVWQDMDTSLLSEAQLDALQTWVGAGGRLLVVGGTTGTSTLGSLPADLLPFLPSLTVDVATTDLDELLGELPEGATGLPAFAGLLDAGSVLGRSGDHVFAAQRTVGQGTVTLVGVDPSAEWLTGTAAASSFWRRFVPTTTTGAVINPLVLQDDATIVGTLGDLPAVELPDLAVLFALLLLYIALIGPINYLVLRRLDRREWAWITMPLLVVIFAVAAWGLGVSLKGTDTIVNQVAIVRTAVGTDRGLGHVYVGVFSPTRATYQVEVDRSALLSNPVYLQNQGQGGTGSPLDVLIGERSRLRDLQVGFAVLRSFRAETAVEVPRLDAELTYSEGRLSGTITNRSDTPLERIAVTWGGAVQRIERLEPGASAPVSVQVASAINLGQGLSEMVFGRWPANGAMERSERTRRQVLDQLWWSTGMSNGGTQQAPLILAWTSAPALDIELGTDVKEVGDTLLLYPAATRAVGATVWPNALMARSVLASAANEALDQGMSMSLSRGTMTVELKPVGYDGPFNATSLSIMLTQGEQPQLTGRGPLTEPLPEAQQPPQDDPIGDAVLGFQDGGLMGAGDGDDVGGAPGAVADQPLIEPQPLGEPGAFWDGLPDLQLLDRTTGRWVEFPHPVAHREFRIASPERYVDERGAFVVRFVNRGGRDMTTWFSPLVRLEGEAA